MYKKVTSLDYSTLDITLTSEEVEGKLIYKVYLKENDFYERMQILRRSDGGGKQFLPQLRQALGGRSSR